MADIDTFLNLIKERGYDYENQDTVIPSMEERRRSRDLQNYRRCPHCNERISLSDAISMVVGTGWDGPVKVQYNDGSIDVLHATEVNPQTMRILQPTCSESPDVISRRQRP
jgi:hypothetical protein